MTLVKQIIQLTCMILVIIPLTSNGFHTTSQEEMTVIYLPTQNTEYIRCSTSPNYK